jgi:hypothetical protein
VVRGLPHPEGGAGQGAPDQGGQATGAWVNMLRGGRGAGRKEGCGSTITLTLCSSLFVSLTDFVVRARRSRDGVVVATVAAACSQASREGTPLATPSLAARLLRTPVSFGACLLCVHCECTSHTYTRPATPLPKVRSRAAMHIASLLACRRVRVCVCLP